ncbi:DUF3047 domain-containing protein [Congregibacter brevis]|uniref:DUF3047 domain-containing protein n=1 Tax=Congregibacter brevis TaxID=3081201 RepID=A0ABZ0IGK4_9GAMM|nr:DUF3047 domain-containing protein [Congregibacter sp. IMCC45268]
MRRRIDRKRSSLLIDAATAILLLTPLALNASDVEVAAEEVIAQYVEMPFSHSQEGWRKTGISLRSGQSATIIGDGSVNLGLPVPASASLFLWARIGEDGDVFNVASDTYTFVAQAAGELYLAVRPAGFYWTDRRGTFPADFGGVPKYPVDAQAEVYLWRGEPETALTSMADTDDARWQLALSRYTDAPKLPDEFEYLWYLGQSSVFETYEDSTHVGVRATPSNDAGIIRKALDIPLNDETLFSFDWLYEQLPARGPETEAQYHDYLSIALEFDNGQDLTWFWSSHLEAGEEFTCPLPWWDQRETHIAVQSGEAGLSTWHSHTRSVLQDYQSAVGGELPGRIVGVWVINSGVFGDKPGEAIFANLKVRNGDAVTEVFSRK